MEEDKDMGYGSVNPAELATLSLLDNGRGYDNGYGKAAEVAYTAFQHNDTRHDVRREGDQSANRDNFSSVQAVLQGNRQENMFFASHLDSDRKFSHLTDQITQSRLDAKDCCCETKMLVMQENEKTRDLINAQKIDDLRHALNCQSAALSAATNRSVFIGGDATTSNNSGQQN